MIISAKIIKKPRKIRFCETCDKPLRYGWTLRLYGHAEDGDPPWVMYIHPECVTETENPKIKKALIRAVEAGR